MKQIFLLLFSIFLFSFISYNPSSVKPRYFEGQVTYSIEYAPYDDRFLPERIKEHIGSKMVLTFKNGDYKKEFFAPDGTLLQERFLNLKEEKTYLKVHDTDTIYWVNITKSDSKTKFEVLNDSTIFDHLCKVIKTKTTVTGPEFGEEPIEMEGFYMYAKDLPINPDWYTNFYEENYNDIVKEAKGITLLSINKGIYWEQTTKVTSISKRKVKRSELAIDIDKDAPLKEL